MNRSLSPGRYLAVTFGIMFAVIAAIWIYVVALPMAFLDQEYPRWIAKEQLLAKCELGSTLVLGDSRAAVDLLPDQLPGPVTNLALAGTTPVEMYFALRRALRCPAPPHLVIVSFSPSHFLGPDTFWGKTVRYRFFSFHDLMELYAVSERLGDMSVIGSENSIDKLPTLARIILYTSRFPSIYFNSLIQGQIIGRYRSNVQQEKQVLANRGQYFFSTHVATPNELAAEAFIDDFNPPPVIDYYFRAAVQLLREHNIPTIYVTMPVNYYTLVHMKPGVIQRYHSYVTSVIGNGPAIRWMGEPMPSLPDRFFTDVTDHLNPPGAAAFMPRFRLCLESFLREKAVQPTCKIGQPEPFAQMETHDALR